MVTAANDLLLRLDVSALDAFAGDQFSLSLVPTAFTAFTDQNFVPVAFTSTGGTVTVSSVPEPSGLWFALPAAGVLAAVGIVRRRRAGRRLILAH